MKSRGLAIWFGLRLFLNLWQSYEKEEQNKGCCVLTASSQSLCPPLRKEFSGFYKVRAAEPVVEHEWIGDLSFFVEKFLKQVDMLSL